MGARVKKYRFLAVGLFMALASQVPWAQHPVHGGGATFPFPLYAKWAYLYKAKTGFVVNYISIGSGGGLEQISARTVDFGASEAPLPEKALEAERLVQFPMVAGAVVLAANLENLKPGELRLTGDVVARIYLGKITAWNDASIRALNPGLKLPDLPITVVQRADGSGSTWLFTHYLCMVSPEWARSVGAGTSVRWPVGAGAKGSEGVSAFVKTLPGALGYVQAAYAEQSKLLTLALKNRDGTFVTPSPSAFKAAADQADWSRAPGEAALLLDLPGEGTWPITGASYVLVYRDQAESEKAAGLLSFFDWCLHDGAPVAAELGYVPLPEGAVRRVEEVWATQLKSGGKALWKPAGGPVPKVK